MPQIYHSTKVNKSSLETPSKYKYVSVIIQMNEGDGEIQMNISKP